MKPLPKAIAILVPMVVIGYGIHSYIESRPKSPIAEAIKVETTTVPAEGTTAATAAVEAAKTQAAPLPTTPVAPAAPSGLTPATNDAGLDAVLRATK